MASTSQKLFLVAGTCLVVGGGVMAWRSGWIGASSQSPAGAVLLQTSIGDDTELTADLAVARLSSFEITTTANGELEARNKIEIRSELDQQSTVVRIVPEGTRVKPGDELMALNAEEIQVKVDDEKLKVESARAEFEVARNDHEIQNKENESLLRQSRLKVELAELAMRQWAEGDVVKKRRELELAVERAQLELSRLADVYLRSQELNSEGFLSKNEMDRDEVLYIEAIAEFKISQLAYEVYENFERLKDEKKFESDVAEAIEELDKTKLNNRSLLANKLAEMNNRREQLLGLERKLAKLSKQRDDATIVADREGLVVYGSSVDRNQWGRGGGDSTLTIGSTVSPNQLLMILPDTSEMLAAVRVHESLAGRIRTGQQVTVRIDAAGGVTFSGTVESVGVMAETGGWRDPNLREYTIRVALNTGDVTNLKPAMRCEARIVLDRISDALTVPVQAIFNEGPVQYAYVPVQSRSGNRYTRVPVRVGRRSDTIVEVVKGLDAGQVVLLREPSAGETMSAPFEKEALLAAGYKFDADGKVMSEGGMGMAGGPPPSMPGAGGSQQAGEARRRGGPPREGTKEPATAPRGGPAADATKAPTAPTAIGPTAAPAAEATAAADKPAEKAGDQVVPTETTKK
jgi:HlyD family secretion protein